MVTDEPKPKPPVQPTPKNSGLDMPNRPPIVCARPGCHGLVHAGKCTVCGGQRRPNDRLYDDHRGSSAARGYDARWQKVRAQVLGTNPLCVVCGTLADDVDHITPIAQGGAVLNAENLQPLCRRCHNQKTRREQGVSQNQTMLVCGPPGSGKTTYVQDHLHWGDLVVDLDAILAALSGQAWYAKPTNLLPLALDVRDLLHQRIAAGVKDVSRIYVITSEPKAQERSRLARQLGALWVVVLATPLNECLRRIANDPRRQDKVDLWAPVVASWWANYQPNPGETVIG